MWGQEEVGEVERREGDKLLQMYNLVGYCFAECVGMLPMTNCVLWSCHKMHSDTSTKQLVCQPMISLMFSSAHHHQITLLWTKMHEIFSSRMETTRTCFIKTLLFTFWNGQVNCMCSFLLVGNFLSVTRIWTWRLGTQLPFHTCSSWCLVFTCWWPPWCWSISWLPWCQTLIRGSR